MKMLKVDLENCEKYEFIIKPLKFMINISD